MQQRFEPNTSLDYFPTQPWAVRALCLFLSNVIGEDLSKLTCWEPACGEGHMVRPLRESFRSVRASDVIQYPGFEHDLCDFIEYSPWAAKETVDWIITNPPFKVAEAFVARAMRLSRRGVCMFVRSSFTEGGERYEAMFKPDVAPSYVVTFVERVVCLRNRLIQTGKPDPFNFDPQTYGPRDASTATSYSLVIWLPGQHDTRHRWISPCRVALERPEDFPAYADQWTFLRAKQAEHSQQGELL